MMAENHLYCVLESNSTSILYMGSIADLLFVLKEMYVKSFHIPMLISLYTHRKGRIIHRYEIEVYGFVRI